MAECTGLHDLSFLSVVRDLRLLLLRFARELPFSAESGGGGRDSNIHFVPYLISTALYRVSSARGGLNIDKQIAGFLETPKEKWIQGCYEVNSLLIESTFYGRIALSRWTALWSALCCHCSRTRRKSGSPYERNFCAV